MFIIVGTWNRLSVADSEYREASKREEQFVKKNEAEKQGRGYVTDLKGYEGPIDVVSPYHYYQYTYWNLRKRWRLILYDWTRREPCDATAQISPEQTVAGARYTFTLTVTVGTEPLTAGGRIAVYCPLQFGGVLERRALAWIQGPDGQTGYGSRVTAGVDREGCSLQIIVHSTGSIFTCIEIVLENGKLEKGDNVEIVIGDPFCKRPIVSAEAKSFPLRVAVDHSGEGEFRSVKSIPVIRNVGAGARYLRCFAPATPREGEEFAVRVIAADLQNHNPSYDYSGKFSISAAEGVVGGNTSADCPPERHGTTLVPGVKVDTPEVSRINVIDREKGLMGRTNPVCPAAAQEGFTLYYGEIHSHTELSDGGGLPQESYHWARDVEGLDFSALADHFEDGQSYNYTLEDKWRITREVAEEYNCPGSFVTLLGYEIGTLEQHRNVYFSDGEGRMVVEGPGGERVTMENVYDKLSGTDYILIPHAPKFHGINWHRPHDPERQRLVEICSFWGISEEGGPLSVRHALDLGYKFGFTGGTDNHTAEAGNPDLGGITGVYAKGLTRKDIFDALRMRRTIATTGPRMIINFSVNGVMMGGESRAEAGSKPVVSARAICCSDIECVDVVRNGEVVFSVEGAGRSDVTVEWEDNRELESLCLSRELTDERFAYYYIRVRTVENDLGWSSPVWVNCV